MLVGLASALRDQGDEPIPPDRPRRAGAASGKVDPNTRQTQAAVRSTPSKPPGFRGNPLGLVR